MTFTICACDAPVRMIRGKSYHHDGVTRHECTPITEKLRWMSRPVRLYLARCPLCGAGIDHDGGYTYEFGTSVIHRCDGEAGVVSTPPAPASSPPGGTTPISASPASETATGGLKAERIWDD